MAQGHQARAPGPAGPARAVTVSAVPGTHPGQQGPRECYCVAVVLLGPLKAPVPRPGTVSLVGLQWWGWFGRVPQECEVDLRVSPELGWDTCGGGGDTVGCSLHRWFCLRIHLFPTLLSVATQSYQWYSWGPPNMQCRLCASCWTYWKKYGGLKMPTRLDGERPGPNRNNMVSGTCHSYHLLHVGLRSLASSHSAVLGGVSHSTESPWHPSSEQWEPQVCHEDKAGLLPAYYQVDTHCPAIVP